MNREKTLRVRVTDEEREKLEARMQEAQIKDVSKYVRSILFLANQNEKNYKDILLAIRQMKSELHHAVLVLEKTKKETYLEEIKKCSEALEEMQKELIKTHGGNRSETHETK